jgi:RNA polymerase sigma-70 factor (ECF subfamily)
MDERWSDTAVLAGLLARDSRALEALIARHAREMAYFIRTVLDGVGTAQDVEECVNDAFIIAWEDYPSFDPARGSLRTWLTMRAKYVALDRRRQVLRRQQAVASGAGGPRRAEGGLGESGETATSRDVVEQVLERREQQEWLREALDRLPELDRLLVYLRYFQLKRSEEIATTTGLTRRAIDTRLWRARKVLRETLETLEERSYGHVHISS